MSNMLDNSALTTDNYDNILIGWSEQELQPNVQFGAQNINYCNGADAKQSIIDTYGWIITDGGLDCSSLDIDDQYKLEISIYPNPAIDKLFINGIENMAIVTVYNLLGKEIFSLKTSKVIDVNSLSRGIYIMKIREDQKQAIIRFIKE
jgi:hypothetical protein